MDGFGEVLGADVVGSVDVGDGAGEAEDFVVGAGGEAKLVHGLAEESFASFIKRTVAADGAGSHAGVGGGGVGAETLSLAGSGTEDLGTHVGGRSAGGLGAELAIGNGGDVDVEVDAVNERA